MSAYNGKVTFRNLRKAALVSAVSGLALLGSMTYSHAEETARYQFNIEAQPLAKALLEFSKQTNINIVASGDLVAGRVSGKANGDLSAQEALKSLLQGTGVAFEMRDDNTLIIRKSGAASDSNGQGNSQDISKAMTPDASGSGEVVSGWGSVTGTITDERSGVPLVGALVRIADTDRAVATDDKGNFRFPKVRSGAHTVSISYLGYRGMNVDITLGKNETAHNNYTLGGVTAALEEVVIFGSRSARARALNQERLAENSSSVISSDQMGDFVGTTLAEALRRVPGVTFQRDPATGSGTNIMVRGLSPALNAIKLNGLNLASTNSSGSASRSANLGNILADSVEKVTIHKTLLPSHDSAGTGGLVEIETKSPLSRPSGFANFTLERGMRASDFSNDFLVSGTFSHKFGSEERFGVSASVQYRESDYTNIGLSKDLAFGSYLPLEADGSLNIFSQQDVDPRLAFPFAGGDDRVFTAGTSNSFSRIDDKTLAITLSAEWLVTDNTEWKVDMSRSSANRDSVSGSTSFSAPFFGSVLPIASLGGDLRVATNYDGSSRSSIGFRESLDVEDVSSVYSFRGVTRADAWEFEYMAGYSESNSTAPLDRNVSLTSRAGLPASLLLAEATDGVEGRVISLYGEYIEGYQLPLLTQAGWDYINNAANYDYANASISSTKSKNTIYEAKASAKYELEDSKLKYIQFGVEYKESNNTASDRSVAYQPNSTFAFLPFPPFFSITSPSAADVGLGVTGQDLSRIGIDRGLSIISPDVARAFLNGIEGLTTGMDPAIIPFSFPPHPLSADAFLKEVSLVAYLQGRLEFNKLEIIGGARLDRVKVTSAQLLAPQVFDAFGTPDVAFQQAFTVLDRNEATITNILPRVSFNYRETDNLVFRGGYYLSVARPSIANLSTSPQISLDLQPFGGPNGDQPQLSVSLGNPGLKSAMTHNFDLSAEYYDDNIGVMKLGVFYKRITNLLEASLGQGEGALADIDLPDDPRFNNLPANILVNVSQARNNPDAATIWGIEANIERQFANLPGIWGGLGASVNYTYTKSSKSEARAWFGSPVFDGSGNFVGREEVLLQYTGLPFNQQVPHSGTAALTYNKYNVDASLSYTFQSRRLGVVGDNALSLYDESITSLDLRVEYRFGGEDTQPYRVYIEGADLLKGTGSPGVTRSFGGVNGAPKYLNGGTYLGGRSVKVGVTATF